MKPFSALRGENVPELGRVTMVGLAAVAGSWLLLNSRGLIVLGGTGWRRRPADRSGTVVVQPEQNDVRDTEPEEDEQDASIVEPRTPHAMGAAVEQDIRVAVPEHGEKSDAVDDAEIAERAGATAEPSPPGRVRLMGVNQVEGPNGLAHTRSEDLRALLGLLAENRRTLVTRTHAQDRLWPELVQLSPDRFPNVLKDARARICEALGRPTSHGKLVIQNIATNGYRLNPELITCDVWVFRDLVASSGAAGPGEKDTKLAAAAELYAGPYLAGLPHAWAQAASRRVARDMVRILSQLAASETDPERALSHLEKATGIEDTAEHLYRSRMQLYADLGRVLDVHHCFDELSEVLKHRAAKPERRTVDLYQQLSAMG
ncbi:BTAD domain-containing putative transcriptional regulator [Actinomadura sp. 9N407]|uniref:AfsR/SARP family transcriptional regulator n=1 Tax=Actinomadura sp. 9N407 TaxID=3375154 RepID=UPI0037A333C9